MEWGASLGFKELYKLPCQNTLSMALSLLQTRGELDLRRGTYSTFPDFTLIARKEYHGKSFEGRQCSKLLSCSASLKEVVPPWDPPLVECLEMFHRVVVGVLGQIVDPETRE